MKFKIYIFILFCQIYCYGSDNKVIKVTYKYIPVKSNYRDTFNMDIYKSNEFVFNVQFSDNEVHYLDALRGISNKSLTFRLYNSKWYYKNNSKWKLFLSNLNDKIIPSSWNEIKMKLLPKNKIKNIKGNILYGFYFKPQNRMVSSSHSPTYWFSKEYGIVLLEMPAYPSSIYIRKDFYNIINN